MDTQPYELKEFTDGRDMWEWYDRRIYYNPFENLHLGSNTRINFLIKNKCLGNSESDNDLIYDARDLLFRIRVQDLFVQEAEHIYESLSYSFDTNKEKDEEFQEVYKEWDDLYDLWEGISEDDIREVADEFIGLLDPLTMLWQDPDGDNIHLDENHNFIFTPPKPVKLIDPTFAYNGDKGTPIFMYDEVSTSLWKKVPSKVCDIEWDYA